MDATLAYYAQRGLRLETIVNCGGVFSYPDGLEPQEWIAIEALKIARAAHAEIVQGVEAQRASLERAVRGNR